MAITVQRRQGESVNELINRFRKIFSEEGILEVVKRKLRYIKPARQRYERNKARQRLEQRQRRDY